MRQSRIWISFNFGTNNRTYAMMIFSGDEEFNDWNWDEELIRDDFPIDRRNCCDTTGTNPDWNRTNHIIDPFEEESKYWRSYSEKQTTIQGGSVKSERYLDGRSRVCEPRIWNENNDLGTARLLLPRRASDRRFFSGYHGCQRQSPIAFISVLASSHSKFTCSDRTSA